MKTLKLLTILLAFIALSCNNPQKENTLKSDIQKKVKEYASVKLTTDLSVLSEKEKEMLPLLFKAAETMDDIFWMEAYGDKNQILGKYKDPVIQKFIDINYGPWERLNADEPFITEAGVKPAGANFYPTDMTKDEFESWDDSYKTSLYTLIRRNENGQLTSVPYHKAFETKINEAASLLKQASELAEDSGLENYLRLRAEALLTDDYYASDIAWMDMKDNTIDFVVGPIENYEDKLYGYKAAHEAYVLIKDKNWSKKLERFSALLPELQKELPCEPVYKNEMPGSDSDLNAYDVIYYAGDCNAGSKTIAINLPNDEKVRETKGSRKLQLKNSMQAKFDQIMLPIAKLLIDPEQQKHVKFDAFFENTMFHEVAHGLGLGNTIDGESTVRGALKETYSSIEEGKADILGLWCVYKLSKMGELGEKDLMDNFVTFMAGIFRSVRFGASSAHGKSNMIRFNYFEKTGAFSKNKETGFYEVDFEKMKQAMIDLSDMILKIQGDGDYLAAVKLIQEEGIIKEMLKEDLNRISEAGIPRDIVFEQGPEVLGL